jgi:hypothetical protein
MNRSFLFTASGDIQRIGESIPALNDMWFFGGGEGRSSRAASSLWGAVGGPSYSTISRVFEVVQGMNEPTASTAHKARQLVAYNQVFYMRRIADMMENAAVDIIGLPERRN